MAVDVAYLHPSLNGLHEVLTFTGSAGSRAELGITLVEPVPGAAPDRFYLHSAASAQPRRVTIGTLFVRPLRQQGGTEVPIESGGWTYWADSWGGREDAIRVNVRAWAPNQAPGENMLTPLGAGTPLYRNGVRVVRPASGQPDVDRWTGEVLVPEVLVP